MDQVFTKILLRFNASWNSLIDEGGVIISGCGKSGVIMHCGEFSFINSLPNGGKFLMGFSDQIRFGIIFRETSVFLNATARNWRVSTVFVLDTQKTGLIETKRPFGIHDWQFPLWFAIDLNRKWSLWMMIHFWFDVLDSDAAREKIWRGNVVIYKSVNKSRLCPYMFKCIIMMCTHA